MEEVTELHFIWHAFVLALFFFVKHDLFDMISKLGLPAQAAVT